jgi:hypothetical protein
LNICLSAGAGCAGTEKYVGRPKMQRQYRAYLYRRNAKLILVEMQNLYLWTRFFKQRMLFNASKAYVRQLETKMRFYKLRPVYSLNFVNEPFNSTWFQISSTPDFSQLNIDHIRYFENLFGAAVSADSSKDIHLGINILEYNIGANALPNGRYYPECSTEIRMRNGLLGLIVLFLK